MDYWYILDFHSYWNVWFWLIVVMSWSVSAHFTFGVPHDLVQAADRRGGIWAEQVDQLARIHLHRIVELFDRGGAWIAAGAGFVLSVIGTFGWFVDFEFARALFVVAVPHVILGILSVRRAFQLYEADLSGEPLRRALKRWRFWTQVMGLFAIAGTATCAVIETLSTMTLFNEY